MSHINISYHETKIGELIIGSFNNQLCLLDFRYRKMRDRVDNRLKKQLKAEFIEQQDEIILKAKQQVDEYLIGTRKEFDIPLLLVGTDFQKQVWHELLNIDYGETIAYSQLATRINNPKAVRAVGTANGANAIALIVPCHRVIANDGSLGGYSGGLAVKKRLLQLEDKNRLLVG